MPHSLRGSVDTFVASGGIPTSGLGVRHVGIVEIMYFGRCSPCVCELLNTCGKYYVLCALYFMSNFTLT
jgi:hypothetical protein